MNKSVRSKNTKFIIIVSVFIIVGVIVFTFITTKTNPFQGLIGNIVGDEVKTVRNDNYNGFYTKKDLLDSTYKIFNGCSVNSIENYILVQDDNYTLYRSSCMGSYIKEKGKTKDLKIDIEDDRYVITYKENKYQKDTTVKGVVANNDIAKKLSNSKINLASFPIIVKETEFEGNYYDINVQIDGAAKDISLTYTRNEEEKSFYLYLYKGVGSNFPFYSTIVRDGDKLPLLYSVGKQIVIINAIENPNSYNYLFKAYDGNQLSFDLSSFFPIKIDGTELSYNTNSIYIKYNDKEKNFTILVGNDKKFCVENSNSDRVAAYIFKINYNYNTGKFEKPEYIKSIKGADGCSEVESYMGD